MAIINGISYEHSSCEIRMNSSIFLAIKEITYDDEVAPGYVQGTRANWVRRTSGTYKPTASLTMQSSDFQSLIEDELGGTGYATVEFPMRIVYYNAGEPAQTDILYKCRIKKASNSSSAGADPSMIKVDLDIEKISRNGVFALEELA